MGKPSVIAVKPEDVIIESNDQFNEMSWSRIPVPKSELNLQIVLKCGQSFRWTQFRESSTEWIGVLSGKLFVVSQNDEELLYKVLPAKTDDLSCENVLKDYFQLKVVKKRKNAQFNKAHLDFKHQGHLFPPRVPGYTNAQCALRKYLM